MAKKKNESETKEIVNLNEKKFGDILNKIDEHQKTIESFRMSFQNLENKIKNLIERNRLR